MSMARISPTSRNFVIAYILLVGVPLLGLAGVLKVGHALTAPISVDGAWTLETSSATPLEQMLQNSVLTISQSGNGLVIGLGNGLKPTGTGVLSGTALDANLPLPEMATNHCGSDATLALSAAIDSKAEPKTMLGTIAVRGCALGDEVRFRALRQNRSSTKKESH